MDEVSAPRIISKPFRERIRTCSLAINDPRFYKICDKYFEKMLNNICYFLDLKNEKPSFDYILKNIEENMTNIQFIAIQMYFIARMGTKSLDEFFDIIEDYYKLPKSTLKEIENCYKNMLRQATM